MNALASSSLSRDPLADVRIAVHQRNVGSFALSEKNNAILTGQSHVFEVENDAATFLLSADLRFQLNDALLVDPTAKGKDYVPVRLSVDSQHRLSLPVELQAEAPTQIIGKKNVARP
jgi:hypothetical protein